MTARSEWVRAWFAKADNDFLAAEVLLEANKGAFDTICFHCQQCAEKYMKGYLAHYKREIPKTHHLEKLLLSCVGIDSSFTQLATICEILTGYAVETRYPDDYYEYTREEAAQALGYATQIKDFICSKIM